MDLQDVMLSGKKAISKGYMLYDSTYISRNDKIVEVKNRLVVARDWGSVGG